MYFVIFESAVPKSRAAISAAYYAKLQKLLSFQPGFISEVPFGSPFDEEGQTLISKFDDEASVREWRLQHDHLKIEKKARETILEDYRLRAGPKVLFDNEVQEKNEGIPAQEQGRYVILYERPITENLTPLSHEITAIVDATKFDVSVVAKNVVDFAVYQGAETALWVSGWSTKAAAIEFEKSIQRVPSDDVHLIRVARDYGKNNRAEAPEGADVAQATAALEDVDAASTVNVL